LLLLAGIPQITVVFGSGAPGVIQADSNSSGKCCVSIKPNIFQVKVKKTLKVTLKSFFYLPFLFVICTEAGRQKVLQH